MAVSRFFNDPISITYMLQSTLLLDVQIYTFSCKYKIFLMAICMIYKYGKRFRFAPSFNKEKKLMKFDFASMHKQ